jgi:hypothetical protein
MKALNRVRVFTATAGQGTLTLGAAVSDKLITAIDAGATDGDVVGYCIEEGLDFELGKGTIGGGGTTLTRSVAVSKISGIVGTGKMELSGDSSVQVFLTETAEMFNSLYLPETIYNADQTIALSASGRFSTANKASAIAFTLPALAGTDSEAFFFRNIGAGTLTLDPNASETIEGASNIAITTGMAALIWPNSGKTTWRCQIFGPTAIEVHGSTSKTTPVDADEIGLIDSAASFILKKLTWANLKATLAAGVGHMPAGSVVDSAHATYATNASLTNVLPLDDTVPFITEGTEILSLSITPKSATNKLRCRFSGQAAIAAAGNIVVAMFQGSTCIDAQYTSPQTGGEGSTLVLETEYTPGSTSVQTISVRVGPGSAGTVRMNGTHVGRFLGGASNATLIVEEIKA